MELSITQADVISDHGPKLSPSSLLLAFKAQRAEIRCEPVVQVHLSDHFLRKASSKILDELDLLEEGISHTRYTEEEMRSALYPIVDALSIQ